MPLKGDDKRNYEAKYSRRANETVRDCLTFAREKGLSLDVKDPKRRELCAKDFHAWLLAYHPPTEAERAAGHAIGEPFYRPFSKSHRELIDVIQRLALEGGSTVVAMPRESGKTTIMVRALIWAALNGHRRFPVLGTSDDGQFKRLMDRGIKVVMETNSLLAEDYPEVFIPILALERMVIRCRYQTWDGEPTRIGWGMSEIVFPDTTLTRERGNASVVMSGGGLTGALRGMVYALPTGEQLRPDMLLIDDPQTRSSAKSPSQVQDRELIIKGDLMGMRGKRPMAAMVSCTPIYPDDLAIRLLDNVRSPQFKSIRIKMLASMPTNLGLWEEYDVVRRQVLAGELAADGANAFYQQRRAEMDAGAVHYWPEKCDDGKVSAIQCAMEEYLEDPRVFMAEKQCEPEEDVQSDLVDLNASDLIKRVSPYERLLVDPSHTVLTAHVDVQGVLLYFTVCSWRRETFGGNVVEYQTWPKQRSAHRYFRLNQIKSGLAKAYPGQDQGGELRAGIRDCVRYLSNQRYKRPDGGDLGIDLILVDGRWKSDDVEAGILEANSPIAMMAFGNGIGAAHAPMAQWPKKPGRVFGDHWIEDKPAKRQRRALHVDTNHWKSELHGALSVPPTHQEALRFYKTQPSNHQLIADHCVAEYALRVEARNRTVDEWFLRQKGQDNHRWDNLVGCMVAASRLGVRKAHEPRHGKKATKKKRITPLRV